LEAAKIATTARHSSGLLNPSVDSAKQGD
jgi:hypothetical protein